MSNELCQICTTAKFKYKCPKCNILYCSVNCYKQETHLNCSEQFYKQCIQEELASQASTSKNTEDVHKMLEILQRISNDEPIDEKAFIDSNEIENLNSDDDEEEEDLLKRLEGININNADEVWKSLTNEERLQFETLIQNGEICKFVPDFEPWWNKKINKKIITDIVYNEEEDLKLLNCPIIKSNIIDFDEIMKRLPHPSVKFSLYNILGCYTCTVRFFAGDHLSNSLEATNYFWMISNVLNNNTNFNDSDEALKSIIINGQNQNLGMDIIDDYQIIFNDLKNILDGPFENYISDYYKLSALSDTRILFNKAKSEMDKKQELNKNEKSIFSKKFANFQINKELTKDKIYKLIKKIDFFLSYVKSKKYIENKLDI